MNGHPRVLGYLQRAVNHEFTAAQQYTLQAVQAEALGMPALAEQLRQGVHEELRHAEAFLRRMVALGATPHAGQPRAPQVGRSHPELLRFGLATEGEAIRLYEEACRYCERIGDLEDSALFGHILADEVQHYLELKRQLQALGVAVQDTVVRRYGEPAPQG